MKHDDYIAIARCIRIAQPSGNINRSPVIAAMYDTLEQVAHLIADECFADDPLFDRATFLKSCGLAPQGADSGSAP